MYTIKDIVNACLIAIGNEQVANLEYPDVDTDTAITVTHQTILDVLNQGWWFNTEIGMGLQLDNNNELVVPKGLLGMKTTGPSINADVVSRSGKFYDVHTHSFDLKKYADHNNKVYFDFVINLEIDDIPPICQTYIRNKAVVNFLLAYDPTNNQLQSYEVRAQQSFAPLQQEQLRNRKFNSMDSPHVRRYMAALDSPNNYAVGHSNPLGGYRND